jgi:phosphate transport system permease protein
MSNRNQHAEMIEASLKKRYARERRFQWYGRIAVLTGFVFLLILLTDIVIKGSPAFTQQYLQVTLSFDAEHLDLPANPDDKSLGSADYGGVIKAGLREMFPQVSGRKDKRLMYRLVSVGAEYALRDMVLAEPSLVGQTRDVWLLAHAEAAAYLKGQVPRELPESDRKVKNLQMDLLDRLREQGRTESRFNTLFFTAGDSREPELAGIRAALHGSFYTLLVTFLLAFPIGVSAAVYLEEFAPRNRLTDLIEININNLAAVPSIVFGLLGLAVFINFFELPRSAPLVGGIVLSLMTLPTIIITSRASIQAVSPSIREAAYGVPVQVFLWADSPERGFTEKTSAAIMVLMAFLIVMNALAIYLRKRFELK